MTGREQIAHELNRHQHLMGPRDEQQPAQWFSWCACGWDGGPVETGRGAPADVRAAFRLHVADGLLALLHGRPDQSEALVMVEGWNEEPLESFGGMVEDIARALAAAERRGRDSVGLGDFLPDPCGEEERAPNYHFVETYGEWLECSRGRGHNGEHEHSDSGFSWSQDPGPQCRVTRDADGAQCRHHGDGEHTHVDQRGQAIEAADRG